MIIIIISSDAFSNFGEFLDFIIGEGLYDLYKFEVVGIYSRLNKRGSIELIYC